MEAEKRKISGVCGLCEQRYLQTNAVLGHF